MSTEEEFKARWKLHDVGSSSEFANYYEVEIDQRGERCYSILSWRCDGTSVFDGIYHVDDVKSKQEAALISLEMREMMALLLDRPMTSWKRFL